MNTKNNSRSRETRERLKEALLPLAGTQGYFRCDGEQALPGGRG